jgi:hypothetical protein
MRGRVDLRPRPGAQQVQGGGVRGRGHLPSRYAAQRVAADEEEMEDGDRQQKGRG